MWLCVPVVGFLLSAIHHFCLYLFIFELLLLEACVYNGTNWVYCVGKLQQLRAIIADLQAAGQRAVILSQTSQMLDLLESFMGSQRLRYLRLDSQHNV